MPIKYFRTLIILLILLCNVGCDQVSKQVVRHKLEYNQEIGLLNKHLTITKVENSGAFLSLGDNLPNPWRFGLLTLIPLLVLGFASAYMFMQKSLSFVSVMGLGFIVGGGVGNLYDRLVHGSVTDFLHIDFGLFETGVFNMADVSIMAGTSMLLISRFKRQG